MTSDVKLPVIYKSVILPVTLVIYKKKFLDELYNTNFNFYYKKPNNKGTQTAYKLLST